jgi:hypothetical protein
VDETAGGAVELAPGYPAYCIYIPTGMSQDFEKSLNQQLQDWGRLMGKNVLVAPWNIGDPSYIQLMRKLGFTRRPAIILTDDSTLKSGCFIVKVDDPLVVRDISKLASTLPALLDLILLQNCKEAAKEYVKTRRAERIKSLSNSLSAVLGKINVSVSWGGVTVGVGPQPF